MYYVFLYYSKDDGYSTFKKEIIIILLLKYNGSLNIIFKQLDCH